MATRVVEAHIVLEHETTTLTATLTNLTKRALTQRWSRYVDGEGNDGPELGYNVLLDDIRHRCQLRYLSGTNNAGIWLLLVGQENFYNRPVAFWPLVGVGCAVQTPQKEWQIIQKLLVESDHDFAELRAWDTTLAHVPVEALLVAEMFRQHMIPPFDWDA